MTLRELIGQTERRFRGARLHYGHGTHNARDEAAFLVLRGLRLPFESDLSREIPQRSIKRVESLIRRRIEQRIPVSYLLNEAWLAGHCFYVDRRVIVPRSHIAGLLHYGLRPWLERTPRRVLDLCTGSGCLAILAALAFPRARVDAIDVSRAALAVARKNIARYHLRQRVSLARSDLFDSLSVARYDLIITNPPYVTSESMRKLPREYRWEPGIALAAGASGLDLVGRILAEAPRRLRPGGLLVCEVGAGRRALERAYPRVPFVWPQEAVFILEREALSSAARAGASTRTRSIRARAKR